MSLSKPGWLHRLVCGEFYSDDSRPPLTPKQLSVEILSGLTVSLALVPEAVAFAFVAGVAPLVGLYAAFIVGLVTALFGGRPGMISGATGALAVVMVSLVVAHGVQYLFATVILMGILQLIAGILRWGKFIRMVPYPVMLGFVNGLAIVIGLAQLEQFKIAAPDGDMRWMEGEMLYATLGMIVLTMLVIWQAPRVTRLIPAPLAAIGIVTAVVIGFGIDVPRVGDLASLAGGLPAFAIPMVPFTLDTLVIIFPYALILAAIGLIESLLTLNLVGDMTEQRGGASRECAAQGAANLVTGFIRWHGRLRDDRPVDDQCEIGRAHTPCRGCGGAVPAGLHPVHIAADRADSDRRACRGDAMVILTVTAVTVAEDLAIAVVVGVIMSALVYAWNAAKAIQASKRPSVREKGAIVYDIKGPLFFGSATGFRELFQIKDDPDTVIIDFAGSRVVDESALQAIEDIAAKYHEAGKTVMLRHLSADCQGRIIDDPE